MAQRKRKSRLFFTLLALALIGAALAAAFWPRAIAVDLGEVTRGPMMLTIDEVGRTRVSEPYVVSTPVAGRLQRVKVHPGDPVVKGKTIIAHMLPTSPAALDIRTREQARATTQAAEAALRVARADHNAALASFDQAEAELARVQTLVNRQVSSKVALERQQQVFRVASATVERTEAAISMREADLANARAQMIDFDDRGDNGSDGTVNSRDIPLYAPADGRVLRVMQESETTLASGIPIMEIGDVEGDLEVVVDLLSSDALQVQIGDPVIIANWGGPRTLEGKVARIDPLAITKYSALGVEEQRVPVTVALTAQPEDTQALGHGYRVEARIVVWQEADALRVPSSALFRQAEDWALFVAQEGVATLRPVRIGRNNGIEAEVLGGLNQGEAMILYPSAIVADGIAIKPRSETSN